MANGALRLEEELRLDLGSPEGVASVERLPGLAGTPPSGVPSLATGEGVEFSDLLGDASTGRLPRDVGTGVDEIHPADLEASGDVAGVVAAQRPKSNILRPFLDLTANLLGEPSGSQEAAVLDDPKDMSRFQKISLWTADLIAMSEGRVRPSDQLDLQRFNAFSLDDLRRQQKAASGFELMVDMSEQLSGISNRADRFALAQSLVTGKQISPGLEAAFLMIVDQPTGGDALAHLVQNENFWKLSRAEKVMNIIASVAPWDEDLAGEYLKLGFEKKIFEESFEEQSPAIIAASLPEMIEAGRRSSDPKVVEISNTIAANGETTPEDVALWLTSQPDNHNVGSGVINAYMRNPENHRRLFNTTSIERMKELEKNETEGKIITLMRKNSTTGKWEMEAGRENSVDVQRKLDSGWVPVGQLTHATTESEVALFGTPTPAMKTNLQKDLLEIRQNADELIGIEEGFDLSLLTRKSKLRAFTLEQISSFTGELNEEDMTFMQSFLGNKTRMLTALSALLNRMSGAAVSPQEFERLKGSMPSPDDTPIEAQIKMQTAIALNAFRIARANVFLNMGDQTIGEAFNLRREDVRTSVSTLIADRIAEEMDSHPDRSDEFNHVAGMERAAKELGVRVKDLNTIQTGGDAVTFRGERL